ncbi:MAG TPA: hypothetical protein VGO50_06830 [Pyrinomonadaceae bacterium]|jgi:hypothetical protein|nr:hypothetical protein [Pyrinomonadaceae bacterium]
MSNDLSFDREYTVEVADARNTSDDSLFAVCIRSDDEKLLVPLKIYRIKLRGENILVVDEEGEASVYPESFFTPLKLGPILEKVLSNAVS